MTTILNKKPINYLNNKDLLKEIHVSKNTYCTFLDPIYNEYDTIIDNDDNLNLEKNLEQIWNPQIIAKAKENRAKRLNDQNKTTITSNDIPVTDLVFRVYTWDHIPVSQKQPKKSIKRRTAKDILDYNNSDSDDLFEELDEISNNEINNMIHAKVNFVPFQHYKIDSNNTALCVGKSHWQGDITNGKFSKDHGNITKKLAKMFIMLADKYSSKWNWRGYSYVDEMRASAILQLTYIGLRFNESKSENPFSYYTQAITNSFCRVLNTEKRVRSIRDDMLELNNLNPSYTRMNNNTELSDN